MPEPEVLAAYDEALPGSAERIMRAFESVTTDAGKRDDKITDAMVWVRTRGAGWAFFFILLLLVASIVFFAVGNPVAGATLIGAPVLIGLVSLITYGAKRGGD